MLPARVHTKNGNRDNSQEVKPLNDKIIFSIFKKLTSLSFQCSFNWYPGKRSGRLLTSSRAIIAAGWQAYKVVKVSFLLGTIILTVPTIPPCHPSVPLIGKIPPMCNTFFLGGQI
jgi:hypothetical protein